MPTLSLGEQLGQMSSYEVEEAITKRRELIGQMVGTLYPSLLFREIEQLEEDGEGFQP